MMDQIVAGLEVIPAEGSDVNSLLESMERIRANLRFCREDEVSLSFQPKGSAWSGRSCVCAIQGQACRPSSDR